MTVRLYKKTELIGEVRFDETLSLCQCYLFSTKNAPNHCDGFIFCDIQRCGCCGHFQHFY